MTQEPQMQKELTEGFEELELEDRLNVLLTQWMFRLKSLGQLKDFLESTGGFWTFECREINKEVTKELIKERERGQIEMATKVYELLAKHMLSSKPEEAKRYLDKLSNYLAPFVTKSLTSQENV